jgi:tetratricopeptide (TPR) repeat protein
MQRWGTIALFIGISLAVAGCPKGRTNFNQGRKAQNLQDYDAAFEYYQKALKTDPENAEYRIKFDQARFGAGEAHTKKGLKLREQSDLENAASEFRKAAIMDPSSVAAEQELRKTMEMIDDRERAANAASEPPPESDEADLASTPPQLKPLSRAPINLKMSNDAKVVFDTIGKLAGLTVIYDPDFPARRISVELNDVTLEQALDIVCIESKAFSTPISENIIVAHVIGQFVADFNNKLDLAKVETKLKDDPSITMLVNNAGFASVAPLLDADIGKMEDMIALNITALTRLRVRNASPSFLLAQEFLPIFRWAGSTHLTEHTREVLLRFEAASHGDIQHTQVGRAQHLFRTLHSLAQDKPVRAFAG